MRYLAFPTYRPSRSAYSLAMSDQQQSCHQRITPGAVPADDGEQLTRGILHHHTVPESWNAAKQLVVRPLRQINRVADDRIQNNNPLLCRGQRESSTQPDDHEATR